MSPTESSREENVYMAKLAEQAERYEEMVEFMEKVAKADDSTGILLSLRLVLRGRKLLRAHCWLTSLLRILLLLNWLQLTQ
ncbi:protein 14-3-3-LIKE PROTEIN GF14-F [Salix purpurea]|uniref:Protein 14-3-3-LIKE PROTEIN GF14-F n=1 Tax=Salix purpurea TaxID=77065 RepID=A0A9Q1ACR0_SALPP|nr:protein 14-3-3-LIKE PROTEIN GF14-F [Salix purpurea]